MPAPRRADPRALALPASFDGLRTRRGVNDAPHRRLFEPPLLIACLRGRVMARKALREQAEGDSERMEHERAIAEYEAQIEALCAVAGVG